MSEAQVRENGYGGHHWMCPCRPCYEARTGTAPKLRGLIREAINKCSAEHGSNTSDATLADYLMGCLEAFDRATCQRDRDMQGGGL